MSVSVTRLYKKDNFFITILILSVLFFSLTFAFNYYVRVENHYSLLAQSVLKGRFDLSVNYKLGDTFLYNSKAYWYHTPFPLLILLPFTFLFNIFGIFLYQGYLQFFITLGIFILAYKLAGLHYSREDSLYLAYAFCFSSVYQVITFVPISWYFAHSVAAFLSLLALYEYTKNKRYVIIGILYAMIFSSRHLAGLGILFFIVEIFTDKKRGLGNKIVNLAKLIIPPVAGIVFLLWYDYIRFGELLKNGNLWVVSLLSWQSQTENLFSISNLPLNLYFYFFRTLRLPLLSVEPPGTSFFVVSPIFLYSLKPVNEKQIVKHLLIPVIVILFLLLTYRWHGWVQVGPRYIADILPFLYLILLNSFTNYRLSALIKSVIIISSIFNLYLFLTVFL